MKLVGGHGLTLVRGWRRLSVANARLIVANERPIFGSPRWILLRDLLRLADDVNEARALLGYRTGVSCEPLDRAGLESELSMLRDRARWGGRELTKGAGA